MRLSAVIGANYGDEGKGHATDFLSDERTLVVRFNGGAQAGHTVTTPEGRRHVFHHFGAGTLRGATTFLSRYFIVNPILFRREHAELGDLAPAVLVDFQCPVTTPYDMMLNQAAEAARGCSRHGSCGAGINETVTRGEHPELRLEVRDLDRADLRSRLDAIRWEWVPQRAKALGVDLGSMPYLYDDAIRDRFLEDCAFALERTRPCSWGVRAAGRRAHDHVVFEGAQGLRLDELSPDFPHVTRSRTGLTNVLELMHAAGLAGRQLDIRYVTRPYLTRHGAGPLPHELADRPYPGIVDRTNVPNMHQGTIRYAWLDPEAVATCIKRDLDAGARLAVNPTLVVTCADQVPARVTVAPDLREAPVEELAEAIGAHARLNGWLLFHGETREAVRRADGRLGDEGGGAA